MRREELLPSTGNDDRPYMLVTHSKMSRGADLALFGKHKGIDRGLMLWDEVDGLVAPTISRSRHKSYADIWR